MMDRAERQECRYETEVYYFALRRVLLPVLFAIHYTSLLKLVLDSVTRLSITVSDEEVAGMRFFLSQTIFPEIA